MLRSFQMLWTFVTESYQVLIDPKKKRLTDDEIFKSRKKIQKLSIKKNQRNRKKIGKKAAANANQNRMFLLKLIWLKRIEVFCKCKCKKERIIQTEKKRPKISANLKKQTFSLSLFSLFFSLFLFLSLSFFLFCLYLYKSLICFTPPLKYFEHN